MVDKASTYKIIGNKIVERNKYEQKLWFPLHHNDPNTKYDKYGRRIGTIKEN